MSRQRKTWIAVGVQLALMLVVLVPPMVVRATGTTVWLETDKMDPRALFRGRYVILGYQVAQGIVDEELARRAQETDRPVYVTVTTDRPAEFVDVGLEEPDPAPGEACLTGRVRGWDGAVDFPQIAQFFAPEERAKELEGRRGENLLARVKVTERCDAVLEGLEAR